MSIIKYKDPTTGQIKKLRQTYIEKVHTGAEEPTDPNINIWIKEVDSTSDEYIPTMSEVQELINSLDLGDLPSSSSVFIGTRAEVEALSEEEKLDIEMFVCTDEVLEDTAVVSGKDDVFVGTRAEMEALTDDEKLNIEMFVCTDEDADVETNESVSPEVVNAIIDGTTQVGDAAKLGGKSADSYIQSQENLLTNGDFKINTQGKNSYTSNGNCFDGWILNGESGGSVTLNDDGSVTLTSGTEGWVGLDQRTEDTSLLGKTLTLSCYCNDEFCSVSGVLSTTQVIKEFNNTFILMFVVNANGVFVVRASHAQVSTSNTIRNLKLEIGDIATPNAPTNAYIEQVKCGLLNTTSLDVSITSDMWVFDETEELYKATIKWNGITVKHRVEMNFDKRSLKLASDVLDYTDTDTNCFFLYSDSVVADTLTGVAYAKVVNV